VPLPLHRGETFVREVALDETHVGLGVQLVPDSDRLVEKQLFLCFLIRQPLQAVVPTDSVTIAGELT
jgi:hypothetical protein